MRGQAGMSYLLHSIFLFGCGFVAVLSGVLFLVTCHTGDKGLIRVNIYLAPSMS